MRVIIGTGIDLVRIERIEKAMEKWGGAFERRVFTEAELEYCMKQKRPAEHLAVRFGAKEAVMKAFGTGLSGGVSWKDAQFVRSRGGRPEAVLSGRLQKLAEQAGVSGVHVSFSHDGGLAVAQVILTGDK